jgi:hypothetical protein
MTKKERFRQWAVRPDSSHASGEVAASEFAHHKTTIKTRANQ